MPKAEALFARHFKEFIKKAGTIKNSDGSSDTYAQEQAAIIYSACIIAEAIRQDMDEQGDYSEAVAKQQGVK